MQVVVPYMIAAVVVGAMVTAQPPMNAILARSVESAYAAIAISIFVAFCCSLVVLFATGGGHITPTSLLAVPWWVYLAGVVGAIFVGSGVVIAPITGALVFFVCAVAGQLIGSMLLDHFGAFGLEVREISWARVLGILLVLAGAILVGKG
jgi:transporter family-2 protein